MVPFLCRFIADWPV